MELTEKQQKSFKYFREENQKERFAFIELWANYCLTHDDKDWSRQQNVIIDSQIKSFTMDRIAYLKMNGEKYTD